MKKYKSPLSLFVVFEKLNPIFFTSEVLKPNHYICFINSKWFYAINIFLKKDVFYNFSSLIEMSAIDTYKYTQLIPSLSIKSSSNRLLVYYLYYCYFTKIKLTLAYLTNLNRNQSSVEKLFKNANWLEREASEMYGVSFFFKKDTRSLLLDYSKNEHPMLKEYPSEGYAELYYDFFDSQLHYMEAEPVEL
jgi:NADH dehydrogenase (ubiquinone) Fe-S protein 3